MYQGKKREWKELRLYAWVEKSTDKEQLLDFSTFMLGEKSIKITKFLFLVLFWKCNQMSVFAD